jgi:putative ABC transport system permease protein
MVLVDAEEYCRANAGRPDPDPRLGLWEKIAGQPDKALVSENFALTHGVKPGDTIQLRGEKGMVRWQVAGTLRDYNWIRGTIFVDRQKNKGAFGAEEVNVWEVYLPPGAGGTAAKVREELQQSPLAADQALIAQTRDEVRGGIRAMIRRVYGVAYTQEVIVGIVAVLGVVASLLISVLGRRRELGLLRAIGGTRAQLLQTVLAEAVLIGLVGTLLGIAVGLPMEWYVVRVVLFEETGFLFPVRVPWAGAGVIAALAVLSATLAGLGPAFQAMRLRIADAIAYE